jgi:hypothetical protein
MALGKLVLALPETGNCEQFINAHFLRCSGAGDWTELETVDGVQLVRFLDRLDEFRSRIAPETRDGLPATLVVIRRCLLGAQSEASVLAPAMAAPVPVTEPGTGRQLPNRCQKPVGGAIVRAA